MYYMIKIKTKMSHSLRTLPMLLVSLLAVPSWGQEGGPPMVLLELFTSQGCYSCPPAERLLQERYKDRSDVLALEFHVDYWDKLVYRGSAWPDPFSSPKFTERQFNYTATTTRNPFTPQIIIQGSYGTSGTNYNNIDNAINEVKELNLDKGWDIKFNNTEGKWIATITSKPATDEAEAFVIVYQHHAETRVTAGENVGKLLENNNIVTSFVPQGLVSEGSKFDIGTVAEGESCAVIIQRPPQRVVVGAWSCQAS